MRVRILNERELKERLASRPPFFYDRLKALEAKTFPAKWAWETDAEHKQRIGNNPQNISGLV